MEIGKCGNICSSCPWGVSIRRNQTEEQWESFAADVKKYVGYAATKNPCHGCQTPTDKLSKDVGVHNFIRGCSARKCAFHNEIRNCAYCSRYPCDKIKSLNVTNSRKDAEERLGESIPDDKYLAFVRIFEGMKTLDEIRSDLNSDQIKQVKTVYPKIPTPVKFPKVGEQFTKYKMLHDSLTKVLSSKLGLSDTDVLAGQEMLLTRRDVLLRLLWILAIYGSIDGDKLLVDSITINTYKKGTSGFPTTEGGWNRWMSIIYEVGIPGKLILAPLEKSELTSPLGWLRDRIPGSDIPGYHIEVGFAKKLGGLESLKLLHSYAKKLEEAFGKRAFGKFKKADMRVFEN